MMLEVKKEIKKIEAFLKGLAKAKAKISLSIQVGRDQILNFV